MQFWTARGRSSGNGKVAEYRSPKWWWRVGSGVALQIGALALLIYVLATRPRHDSWLWVGIVGGVMMFVVLLPRLALLLVALFKPEFIDATKSESQARDGF